MWENLLRTSFESVFFILSTPYEVNKDSRGIGSVKSVCQFLISAVPPYCPWKQSWLGYDRTRIRNLHCNTLQIRYQVIIHGVKENNPKSVSY